MEGTPPHVNILPLNMTRPSQRKMRRTLHLYNVKYTTYAI